MKKPSRTKLFTTNAPLEKAMKIIIQYAQSNGYKVDDFSETKQIIILSDTASLTTNFGYIYPIYLSKQSNETLSIEVGIKSKTIQLAGFETPHSRFFNGIKTAIYAIENEKSNYKTISTNSKNINSLFCSNCGKAYLLNENVKFCNECGNEFELKNKLQ